MDRAHWRKHAPDVLQLADEVLAYLRTTEGISPDLSLNYTQNYIGLWRARKHAEKPEKMPCNFMRFSLWHRRPSVDVLLPESGRYRAMIARAGLRPRYRRKWQRYRLVLTRHDAPAKAELLRALGREAYGRHPNRQAPPPRTQLELLSS